MQPIHIWETATHRYSAYVTTRTTGHNEGNVGLHVGDDREAVVQNRQSFFDTVSLKLEDSVWADQVHGTTVAIVGEEARGRGAFRYEEAITETDGLITSAENIPLALVFADCVPLFFCAPAYGVIGVAHAGWKGTVGNIVASMVEAFASVGVPSDSIAMHVGPAITAEHYEVDDRVLDAIKRVSTEAYTVAVHGERDGHANVSLQQVNETLAKTHDVHVTQSNKSTVTDRSFFSYRNGDKSRRFAAILVKETLQ